MDVLIYKKIKTRFINFNFDILNNLDANPRVLRSYLPPNNLIINYELVSFVFSMLNQIERNLSNEFIIELKAQRPYMNEEYIARFITFNYSNLIDKGIMFANSTRGSYFWNTRDTAYRRLLRRNHQELTEILMRGIE